MALTKYKSKRNFNESPEPVGGSPDAEKLRFVVQKHDATHLHYDFRLEMQGVLKSWAVPKGPSTDPEVKRLAMMVEDHPYDYRNFEGVIPSGYGAGTVIVWDEGFYEPAGIEKQSKKMQDKYLQKGIAAGKIHFILKGKKLKGEFALIKTHGQAENAWLLFKVKDKFVSKKDITLQDKSVLSKKTLAQVEQSASTEKKLTKAKSPTKKSRTAPKASSTKELKSVAGKRKAIPLKIAPMLATLVDEAFDEEGWVYEVKWDGYRAIAICDNKKVALKSRNDKSFDEKFYPIQKALSALNVKAVFDGEIVLMNDADKTDFGALQNWRSEADGDIYYYVFDLLWHDGKDLTQLPLTERKSILEKIIPNKGLIRFSQHFDVSGTDFFENAKKLGLEGIIAKKADSLYYPGIRSNEWLKIKANKRQEMVIGGYTKNEGSAKHFSSLLLGVFENGKLVYTGKVGTGFTDAQQKEMLKQFKPLIRKTAPFKNEPDINKPSRFRHNPPNAEAVWLKPELVCEVSYTEMTSDGVMRHPAFEGMRMDKKSTQVTGDKETPTTHIVKNTISKKSAKSANIKSKERKSFVNPSDITQVRSISGHELKFTNLSKIYWPKEKISKGDLINYYYQVAPYILPYLINRPQSMNRHPNGIKGKSFYFKDVTGTAPSWVKTFKYKSESDNRLRKYLVAEDDASLLYMANLGCIEMNPWHSRVESEDYPDWCIIDLDPAENTFQQVIDAANVTKGILEDMGVKSYPKTSGSTGIHVYIPLGAQYTYEQSKEFARVIATLVNRETPKFTSIERIVKARKGKMYIDFLQNRPQATVAAPYSLRPKPGATVSMPLHWEEVKKGLKMQDFTIFNALERIKSDGDLFKPVLGKGVNLEKVISKFNKS